MLFGREEELARLRDEANLGGPVVLLGPPGVGKTTLARAALPDAAFIDLSSATDVDEACSAIAGFLGLTHVHGALTTRIGQRLAGTVTILDNVEQIEGIEGLIEGWRDAMLVITTQRTLALPHGKPFEVGPLSTFHMHALIEARTGTDWSERLEPLVARTGGLPLAAEVFAGLLALGSPAQLVELLEGAGLGQNPLQRAIGLATQRLAPLEHRALACLAVFEGRFDLADAMAVMDRDRTPSVLSALVERSLVSRWRSQQQVWFRLLPPVRAHVVDRVDDDDPAWNRHAMHVVAVAGRAAEAWTTHGARTQLDQVTRWRPDLERIVLREAPRVAASALKALGAVLAAGLRAPSVSRLARRVWNTSGTWPPTLRAEVAIVHALSIRTSHREETVAVLRVMLDAVPPGAEVTARLHQLLSIAMTMLGKPQEALVHARQAAASAAVQGDPALQARALCGAARARRMLLDVAGARADLDAARSLAVAQSCVPIAVFAETQLALLLGSAGELGAALEHVERGWEMAFAAEVDPMTHIVAAHARGITWAYAAPADEALDVLDACIAVLPEGAADRRELELLRTRVDLLARGPTPVVLAALRHAARAGQIVDNDRFASEMEATLGLALAWAGEVESSGASLARALELTHRARFAVGERFVRGVCAIAARRRGNASSEDEAWLTAHPGPSNGTASIVTAVTTGAPVPDLPRYALLDARLLARFARAEELMELRVEAQCTRVRWHTCIVDLSRRHPARRVLLALVQAHPRALSQDRLIEAGWPDECMTLASGRMRLHTTVRVLRKLGLAQVIETTEHGYRIAGGIRVVPVQRGTFSSSIS